MARNPPVRLNLPGLNKVMKSKGVSDKLDSLGHKVARTAGRGFVVETDRPEHRWIARTRVRAATREARIREAREDALKRALDAARER